MSASQSTCSTPVPPTCSSSGRTLRSCRQNPINYAEITNPMYPTYSRLEGYRDVYNKYMEFCREENIQPIHLPCFSLAKTDIANRIERGVTSSLDNPSTPVLHLPRFTGDLDKKASATLRIFFSRDEMQDIFDIDEEIWIDRQQTYFSKLFPQKFKALLSLNDDEVELYNDLCAFEQEKDPDARDNEEDEEGRRRNSRVADTFETISNENSVSTNPSETNTTKRHVGILLKCLCKKLATRLAFTSREVQMYNKICNTRRMSAPASITPPETSSADNCAANTPVVDLTTTTTTTTIPPQNSTSSKTSSNETTLDTSATIVKDDDDDDDILEIIGDLDACVNGNDDDDNCSEYREDDDACEEQPPSSTRKTGGDDGDEEEEDGIDDADEEEDDDCGEEEEEENEDDDDETLCMNEDEILEAQKEAKKLEKEIIQPNELDAKSHGTDSFVVPDDYVEEEEDEENSDGNENCNGDDIGSSDEDEDFSDLVEEEEEEEALSSLVSAADKKKRPATSDHGGKSGTGYRYPQKRQKKSDKNTIRDDDDDEDYDDSTE